VLVTSLTLEVGKRVHLQLRNGNHELTNAVEARVIATMIAVLTQVLVCRDGRKVLSLIREDCRATTDYGVDGHEASRLVPVSTVDGLIVGDAELARATAVLGTTGEIDKGRGASNDRSTLGKAELVLAWVGIVDAVQRVDLKEGFGVKVERGRRVHDHVATDPAHEEQGGEERQHCRR
jgi:hypothetical protein